MSLPPGMFVWVDRDKFNFSVRLVLENKVTDVTTGAPTTITVTECVDTDAVAIPDYLYNTIQRMMYNVVTHEVDEWFTVHGNHFKDPHPNRESK